MIWSLVTSMASCTNHRIFFWGALVKTVRLRNSGRMGGQPLPLLLKAIHQLISHLDRFHKKANRPLKKQTTEVMADIFPLSKPLVIRDIYISIVVGKWLKDMQ